ncbi:MAG: DinB family protein [Chitinophagaceae bacterium]|nr:DinB family protein [Chitinophagaceae bacterium]
MNKIVCIILLLIISFLSVVSHAQPKDSLLVQLSRKWTNAKAYTLKMVDLMPAENFGFKPVAEEMSFKEQLLHIAKNMKWLSSVFLLNHGNNGAIDTATIDKAALIKILTDAYDQALSAHHLNVKQLDEKVSFFAGPLTRRQILILMHDHQTHHVGQIIVYLRL